MKTRLLAFFAGLRQAGLTITTAETLDAVRAVAAVGIDRELLREALATTLVKDQADRACFDAVFENHFGLPVRHRRRRDRRGQDATGSGSGESGAATRVTRREPPAESSKGVSALLQSADAPGPEPGKSVIPTEASQRLAASRMLLALPFHQLPPHRTDSCSDLVEQLARQFHTRLRRRQTIGRRSRIDIRRTVRRSLSCGGVPIEPIYRERRPGKPDLITLCDLSYSVAFASNFLLALLAPSTQFFRRVRMFGFVDRPVEISFESKRVVPHGPIDLYARSSFGHVLVKFWEDYEALLRRNTIILVLGDARNNRHPPRADILCRMRASAARVVWLNPEPIDRWNTGDSVIASYERHCDLLIAATNAQQLFTALKRVFRKG